MRILHIADIHLDRPFVGLAAGAARERRRDLWEAFRRCVEAAREHRVDLVTVGGDLWEDENVTADTRRSVAHELGRLGVPVLAICGNHDPHLPGGSYARTAWPSNVRVLEEARLAATEVGGGVTVWGASWTGGELDAGFLDRFEPPDGGRHLLLLHGTAQPVAHLAQRAHCPFDPARVREAGFALCLAGHVHAGRHEAGVVYPGSPEPLGWDEVGRHCYAIVDVPERGEPEVELHDVNGRTYEVREVDCSDAESSAAVDAAVADRLLGDEDPGSLCLRLELRGEVDPACEVDPGRIAEAHRSSYAALDVRDRTHPRCDLDALARQPTAHGRFVRTLRERIAAAADAEKRLELELALHAGLRALDGRREVLGDGRGVADVG